MSKKAKCLTMNTTVHLQAQGGKKMNMCASYLYHFDAFAQRTWNVNSFHSRKRTNTGIDL